MGQEINFRRQRGGKKRKVKKKKNHLKFEDNKKKLKFEKSLLKHRKIHKKIIIFSGFFCTYVLIYNIHYYK